MTNKLKPIKPFKAPIDVVKKANGFYGDSLEKNKLGDTEIPEETISRLNILGGYLSRVFIANCSRFHKAAEIKVSKRSKLKDPHLLDENNNIDEPKFLGDLNRPFLAL